MKGKKLFVLIVVILILVFIFLNVTSPKKKNPSYVPLPTPVSVVSLPNRYTSVDKNYTLAYPDSWNPPTVSYSDLVKPFTFSVDGKTYRFSVGPLGGQGIEGLDADSDVKNVLYNGKQYQRIVLSHKSDHLPFYILAMPLNAPSATSYVFSMDIPPTNTDYYIGVFDQIVSHATVVQ